MAPLLADVHVGLPAPGADDAVAVVRGRYQYWHYCCDGVDDRGWGCGYRTLQTLCSWVRQQQQSHHHQQHQQLRDQHSGPGYSSSHLPGHRKDAVTMVHPAWSKNSDQSDVIEVIASGDVTDGDEVIKSTGLSEAEDQTGISVIESGVADDTDITVTDSGVKDQTSPTVTNSSLSNQTGIGVGDTGVADQTSITIGDSGFTNRSGGQGSVMSHDDSEVSSQVRDGAVPDVPTIRQIQQALVAMGDKPAGFVGSRQWIGSYELCLCLDFFYQVPCRIVHVGAGRELTQHLSQLHAHFTRLGSPLMMGGDCDASSKGILGVCLEPAALLVLDPHCSKAAETPSHLQTAGWVKWVAVEDFHQTSFYNLCLPQLPACTH